MASVLPISATTLSSWGSNPACSKISSIVILVPGEPLVGVARHDVELGQALVLGELLLDRQPVDVVDGEGQLRPILVGHRGRALDVDVVLDDLRRLVGGLDRQGGLGPELLAEGQVDQENFYDYEILRNSASPKVEVFIAQNHEKPTQVGEASTPMVAAAVANAFYALTQRRLRHLPFTPDRVLEALA